MSRTRLGASRRIANTLASTSMVATKQRPKPSTPKVRPVRLTVASARKTAISMAMSVARPRDSRAIITTAKAVGGQISAWAWWVPER